MSAYFSYLLRTHYFRLLLTAYAFFVFLGVMPKAPPRAPFQSQFDFMFETVSRSLLGFAVLAALLLLACALWAALAASRGSKAPAPAVPDQTTDRGSL